MATFESIFPTFLSKCAELHALMQAVAFALFVVGLTATVGHGITKRQMFRYLIRLTVLTSLLVFLPDWGNALQDLLKNSILSGLGVDPADVYRQYQQLVQSKQPDGNGSAWWDVISRVQSAVVESFISAVLWLIGHIAAWLIWWAYVFQKIILHLGYAISPVLVGFMAIHGLKHTGGRYLLNLTGVLLWPLGWAVAALVTQAILDFMTDPTFKVLDPTGGFYTLQNQFGAGVLGFWIIFSTFAAPIVIQKVFLYGALAGSELLTSAVRTAVHAATAAVGVVFATGTPIANSVAEMFTMQRYLQMDALRRQNIHHFDSWAGTFGEPVTAMELSPDGAGYRLNSRFARFINVPELMQQFRQVADIQTAEMLKLPVPEIANSKPVVISAPCSPELKELVNSLAARAEALKTGRIDPRVDNMLKITTEGRKAALDMRLLDPDARDHPESKVNLAVDRIRQIWQETGGDRLTQLVFCDLSVPKDGCPISVYDDMKAKLVALGVPSEEIGFIQDYDSDDAKLGLFKDVRAGKVRILLGSTQKMGTGTNVQQRLIALHHLDAPWRPADVEQREGRILRQGNINSAVHIFRYVTEGSFDAYMWQTLETKAKFINQVMTGESNLRRIEDVDGAALMYAEVKAIASGNPLIIEKATIDAEVARLTRLASQHRDTQFRLRSALRRLHEDIPIYERRLEAVQRDIAARQDTHGDAFSIEIDGQQLADRGIAGELLRRHGERIRAVGGERRIGRFAGFEILVASSIMDQAHIVVKGAGSSFAKIADTALGTIRSLEHAIQSLDDTASTLAQSIKDTHKRIHDIEPKIGAPFEYADKLDELGKRQQEIVETLDLTKNQASNRLATTPNEGEEQSVTPKQTASQTQHVRRSRGIRV